MFLSSNVTVELRFKSPGSQSRALFTFPHPLCFEKPNDSFDAKKKKKEKKEMSWWSERKARSKNILSPELPVRTTKAVRDAVRRLTSSLLPSSLYLLLPSSSPFHSCVL